MVKNQPNVIKIRYYSSVAAINMATLLLGFYLIMPWIAARNPAMVPAVKAEPAVEAKKKTVISGVPVRIEIPRLGVDLEVALGVYDPASKKWSLEGLRAHYAEISSPANDTQGRTFIYGHNNRKVFGPLSLLKSGDKVAVSTGNNLMFYYVYQGSHTTNPDDVSIFNYIGPSVLTLQTCTGSFYQHRTMYHFKFVSVKSPGKQAGEDAG